MTRYNIQETEQKWRKIWDEKNSFVAENDTTKPKYYVLEMFPYPSGRIHVGHVRNYSLGDVVARYKKAKGYNVMHPMGWDAFGLPAENAAIENNRHPGKWTYENIEAMRKQLKSMGLSLDWSKEWRPAILVITNMNRKCFWTFTGKVSPTARNLLSIGILLKILFLPMSRLMMEKVGDRVHQLSVKSLNQWFLKITDYAEELIETQES